LPVERVSRIIVIASTVLAAVAHGWLASWEAYLAPTAIVAFTIAFLLARVSLVVALLPTLITMYLAPALLYTAFGISDYHLTLVWLALLAGPVLAYSSVERWHLPGWWGALFAAWALLIALSWPIVAGREIDFSLIAARTLDTPTAMYGGPPPAAAAWIAIVALAHMLGVLWIDLLWARFSGANLVSFERAIVPAILASATIGAAAGAYQGLVDITWVNLDIWSNLRRAGGLMLDANTFGMSGAIWAPVAIVLVWHKRLPMSLAALAYVLLAIATWTSGSRTALVTLGIGTAGIVVAALQRKGWWQPRMAPIVLLIGAAALVLAMFVAPRGGDSPSPLQRVFDRLPRPEAEDLSRFAKEIWTRFEYGPAADRIIAEYPATGAGIGSFHIVFNDFLHRDTGRTIAPDNAQNWWRHQLAELGVLGAMPSLSISALIIALLWRGGPYVEPVGSTTVLRMVLGGVGIASLLGVPTQHPSTWISFVSLVFWLLAMYHTASGQPSGNVGRWTWGGAIALAVVVSVGLAMSARGNLRVPARASWTGVPFAYGVRYEGVSEYGDLKWVARHAVMVVPRQAPWLRLAIFAPQRDVARNPVTVRISMNRQPVIDQTITSSEPVVYFVQVDERAPWPIIETRASREVDPGQALQIATEWLQTVPPDAPAARIIK
jgi:hypothetical protein